MPTNTYESPLSSRYASDEMLYLFSADKKFSTWRRLWVALARAEMELGLPVTQEQVDELEAHITDIDYEKAAQWEKKLRHEKAVLQWGEKKPTSDGWPMSTYGELPITDIAHHPPGGRPCGRITDIDAKRREGL